MTGDDTFRIGEVIPGVSLGELIGRGGFASVYRARQHSLDRDVAVKIDNRRIDDERNQRRFLREAKTAALVSTHPGVVSLYDAGMTSDQHPYFVMELCAGGSLADQMRPGGMPAVKLLDYGVKIAAALAAAHAAGVLHRDIKPANILLDAYGEPRISDFGLAALVEPGEDLSVTLEAFTPAYASPETFRYLEPTTRSDVWALGATLHALYTGTAPRRGPDGSPASLSQIIARLDEPLPRPDRPDANLVMPVLWKATAADPAGRYADAGEFREALNDLARRIQGGASWDEPTLADPGQYGLAAGRIEPVPTMSSVGTTSVPSVGTTSFRLRPAAPPGPGAGPVAPNPLGGKPNVPQQAMVSSSPPQGYPPVSSSRPDGLASPESSGWGLASRPGNWPPQTQPATGHPAPRRPLRWAGWAAGVVLVAGALTAVFVLGRTLPLGPDGGLAPVIHTEEPGPQNSQTPPPEPGSGQSPVMGTCFGPIVRDERGWKTADPVPCDRPHHWEVFKIQTLLKEPQSQAEMEADPLTGVCNRATLMNYLGGLADGYRIEYLSMNRWPGHQERVACVATGPQQPSTGTLKR